MIQNIEIDKLYPHPDNPRKDLGDLTELSESIKARGILQNLTVVPGHEGYTVVIGHRRLAAAKLAGLVELPCVITEMDDKTQVSTMLLENMQREDLTVYEQAQGFQMMIDLGSSVNDIAEQTGFSGGTVRRRLKMTELDQEVLKEVSTRQLSLADFDKLAQIDDLELRNKCLAEIGTSSFNFHLESQIKKQNIKKNLPLVKAELRKLRANKVEWSATYGGKYDRVGDYVQIGKWNGTDLIAPEGEERKLFYCLEEEYGRLSFLVERVKAAPVKRSQSEINREKHIAKTWEEAKEKSAIAYKLRSDFVESLNVNSKNIDAMLRGAVAACTLRLISYISTSSESVYEALGIASDGYDKTRVVKTMEALQKADKSVYPTIIYAAFGDSETNSYATGPPRDFPEHNCSDILNALYGWLTTLGYEMSEDERSMRDGTHELLRRGNDER